MNYTEAKPAKSFLRANKDWLIAWTVIVAGVGFVIVLWPKQPSPVPADVKKQANFAIIYPQGYVTSSSDWMYDGGAKSVTFTAKKQQVEVVFSERRVPVEYQDDLAAYNRFIGGLRPRVNFNVPLGTVSIANFVTAGDYQIVGESAILSAKGTLLIAHPAYKQPSDEEWQALLESLQVD